MAIYRFEEHMPTLCEGVWIHEMAYVGGYVILAKDVNIWPCAVIRGDVAKISIGARSNVQDGAVIHATHDSPEYSPNGRQTEIGEDVTIGHAAVIHACNISNEVLIGMHATVLDGAKIEKQVLLAAGALVPPGKVLQSGWLYAGSPAKAIRELSEKEKRFFKYSALHYIELAKKHNASERIF